MDFDLEHWTCISRSFALFFVFCSFHYLKFHFVCHFCLFCLFALFCIFCLCCSLYLNCSIFIFIKFEFSFLCGFTETKMKISNFHIFFISDNDKSNLLMKNNNYILVSYFHILNLIQNVFRSLKSLIFSKIYFCVKILIKDIFRLLGIFFPSIF